MSKYICFQQLKDLGFRAEAYPHTLHFKRPSGTSRGTLKERPGVFISLNNGPREQFGEFGPLEGLSPDWSNSPLNQVLPSIQAFNAGNEKAFWEALHNNPGLVFAWEMGSIGALTTEKGIFFDSPFARGTKGIPMNGLIWMGSREYQEEQVQQKIKEGFQILKFKVGQHRLEDDLDLLRWVRSLAEGPNLEIRLDANGAFTASEAVETLHRLAEWNIHSIEQPIAPKQWNALGSIIKNSPIPIALDEELIGVENRMELLNALMPPYLILKPMLLGGLAACEAWIEAAHEKGIRWWGTSMLESNIGLEFIAQWVATQNNPLPQGLGTGALYENNFGTALEIRGTEMWRKADH